MMLCIIIHQNNIYILRLTTFLVYGIDTKPLVSVRNWRLLRGARLRWSPKESTPLKKTDKDMFV